MVMYENIKHSWDKHDERVSSCRLHNDLFSCYMSSEAFRDYKKLIGIDTTTLGTKIKVGDDLRYLSCITNPRKVILYLEKEKSQLFEMLSQNKAKTFFIYTTTLNYNRTMKLINCHFYHIDSYFYANGVNSEDSISRFISKSGILFFKKYFTTSIHRIHEDILL